MRVMISCGEPSGDLYAGALATALRALEPSIEITGFGSDRLRAAGASLTGDFKGLSVTGLLEVARVLPRTYATYRRLVDEAATRRPDVFVAIDFPDFNFRLASAVRRLGVPVVYYISPQLWAWRRGRMKTMRQIADRVLVIFPFEAAIYEAAGVPVEWVGHPLLDVAETPEPRERFLRSLGLDHARPVVALLPGSRRNELRQILPDLARAAALVRNRLPETQFIVARAPHLPELLFEPLRLLGSGMDAAVLVDGRADDVLAAADLALVASGTVTVQAALHECPMVVVYRLSPLTYAMGKPFVHVDTYAMANLVAGRTVVPELIQDAFTPEAVAEAALRVLANPTYAAQVRRELREVRGKLGAPGASGRAAAAVLEVARGTPRKGG
ncbi:MAG: lipid-A-disaccharide synthase [Acidobacteria bacterium]|nr:lipid-A-disaccharide synthase [Acidobacteriota bacterium]